MASLNGNVTPATATVIANHRTVNFGYSGAADANANAEGGQMVVFMASFANPPALTDPNSGSRVDIDFWADLG
jgi:hypothetical protein